MASRLILVRHGQTDYNLNGRLQGASDIPLNETGLAQARAVGESLAREEAIAAVYSSPLERAQRTAEAIAAHHDLEVTCDARLRERGFGDWEGLTREEIEKEWPFEFALWRAGVSSGLEKARVEHRANVARRFDAACREFSERHESGTVVVVAHGAAISLGLSAMIGAGLGDFYGLASMGNCHRAVVEVRRAREGAGWVRLTSLNLPPDFAAAQ
ncbi:MULTISPECIES: histidine phosphatase family protein [Dermabacter]|uniref:Histidine phosphatase family protein n=1 Tax=Dermabacter vaginalis TaxID=1630135 RepID=A0ABX6A4K9_9MICO|nr:MULTISPECIES: histidine phosphatase family protein [Dermabacter]QEU11804.1 histidine phosphatase family protein [Dermabacter vaginalis]RUP87326.1 histidine phosphatase family protein [Dermabacter sp. HSID17554]